MAHRQYRPYKQKHTAHAGQAGKEFESDFIFALQEYIHSVPKNHDEQDTLTDMSGTTIDTDEGTDVIYGRLRLDTTIRFSEKDYMPFIAETNIPAIDNLCFKIGVRHGNNYRDQYTAFPEPVIVIGLDCPPAKFFANRSRIDKNMMEHAAEIIQMAHACLDDYVTLNPRDREELTQTPLKPNPNYTLPSNIDPMTKRIYKLRMKFGFLDAGENTETQNQYS